MASQLSIQSFVKILESALMREKSTLISFIYKFLPLSPALVVEATVD
jgi:hypothetical protein